MKSLSLIGLLVLALLAVNCKPDGGTNNDASLVASTTAEALPAPLVEPEEDNAMRDFSAGKIKEACQLAPEAWLRKNIPGFEQGTIAYDSRPSPDGHASSCVCRLEQERKAFVIGYKKSAGNMLYLENLLKEGLKKDYGPNVPPYQEVPGIGQKAAFSQRNGNLAWVTETGVYVYMYLFPYDKSTVQKDYQLLRELAPGINQKFIDNQ